MIKNQSEREYPNDSIKNAKSYLPQLGSVDKSQWERFFYDRESDQRVSLYQ